MSEYYLLPYILPTEEEEEEEEEESAAFPLAGIIGVCVGGALLAVAVAAVCLVCLCIWRFSIVSVYTVAA